MIANEGDIFYELLMEVHQLAEDVNELRAKNKQLEDRIAVFEIEKKEVLDNQELKLKQRLQQHQLRAQQYYDRTKYEEAERKTYYKQQEKYNIQEIKNTFGNLWGK